MLNPIQINKLFDLVVEFFRTTPLSAPFSDEREPQYAARILQPSLTERVKQFGIRDILVAGEGAGPPKPVYHLGWRFFPDITIHQHGSPLVAFEVKYCKGFSRQEQVATAMGQALIYRICGYPKSAVFILDFERTITDPDLQQLESRATVIPDFAFIVRRKHGTILVPHSDRSASQTEG